MSAGIVKSVNGNALLKTKEGIIKSLEANSTLSLGDTIFTDGSKDSVVISLNNGKQIELHGKDSVVLDDSVLNENSFGDEAVADVTDLQRSILNGEGLDDLEATAAGGGAGNGGVSLGVTGFDASGHESNVNSDAANAALNLVANNVNAVNVISGALNTQTQDLLDPISPANPINPISPVNPVEPINPINPVNPIEPINPINPNIVDTTPPAATLEINSIKAIDSLSQVLPVNIVIGNLLLDEKVSGKLIVSYTDQSGEISTKTFTPNELQKVGNGVYDVNINISDLIKAGNDEDGKPLPNLLIVSNLKVEFDGFAVDSSNNIQKLECRCRCYTKY